MVSIGIVGIETDGLLIGSQGLLVALEVVENIAFIVVSYCNVGIEADGLLIGGKGFLVALEVVESSAFVDPLLFCL